LKFFTFYLKKCATKIHDKPEALEIINGDFFTLSSRLFAVAGTDNNIYYFKGYGLNTWPWKMNLAASLMILLH
jgi:hypothetical protein